MQVPKISTTEVAGHSTRRRWEHVRTLRIWRPSTGHEASHDMSTKMGSEFGRRHCGVQKHENKSRVESFEKRKHTENFVSRGGASE